MRPVFPFAALLITLTGLPAAAQMSTQSGYRSSASAGRNVGGAVGTFVGGVTGAAVGTAGGIVSAVTSPLRPRHPYARHHRGRPHRH